MSKAMVCTHILLPRELVEAVDKLVGERKRSQFVAEAVATKVQREKLRAALRETAGILDPKDYPQSFTPEQISEWVRQIRSEDDAETDTGRPPRRSA
jgi:hypothetical protein